MKRILSLDALRGYAILLVLFQHFPMVINNRIIDFMSKIGFAINSGYLGVQIFFVLSGFLITRILIKEKKNNDVSFTRFYLKRMLRIFPIYYLSIIVFGILITWNIDKNAMYYIDTPTSKVVKYKFDSSSGQISDAETIIEIPTEMGYPDGMTIDNDGMLWIALWDGFGVARFDPDTGTLLQKINVPAPKVTSCAFGGENLDTLFITTARVEMSKHALEKYPLSGSIFAAKTGVKGLPALPFKL
jgi:hypothetical protein